MKRLLILLVLGVAGYFGYTYFVGGNALPVATSFSPKNLSAKPNIDTSSIFNILGATTTNLYERATGALNQATDGKAEPIINKAVSDLQDRIKNLPEEEYKRVKYEFCRDVMPSPAGETK